MRRALNFERLEADIPADPVVYVNDNISDEKARCLREEVLRPPLAPASDEPVAENVLL